MYHVQISTFFDILSQSQKAYSRQLEPVCKKWNVSRSEMDVLLFLYNNVIYDRAADIVAHRGMTKSHVSMSVDSLERRGFLERQYSASDRRTAHLLLTEAGEQIAREGREAQYRFFEMIHQGIDEEEILVWERITKKIQKNIENVNITI